MPQSYRPLAGQTALVTGATSGIGLAIVKAIAAAGAAVAVNHRDDAAAADEIVAAIRADDGKAMAIQADVSDEAAVRRMFDEIRGGLGRLDILVANAGIQRDAPVDELTLEQWNQVIATNLTGQFLCVREAIRLFETQTRSTASKAVGKIICMSSVHEVIPWAGHVNYAASKGGVMLMMKSVAQEVAQRGIRVNGIAPGAIRTKINEDAWSTAAAERQLLELIPYGRIGDPDDVAQAAVWLASDASDYVIGTTLFVDGGMTLYPAFRDNG